MNFRVDLTEFAQVINAAMRDDRNTNFYATSDGMESARVISVTEYALYQVIVQGQRIAALEERLKALEGDGR